MLAISTATKKAYIALKVGEIIDYREIDANCKQSENILKEIDFLLEKNNLKLQDVGNFGVVVGPGSFTGLRIGVALVKGLCAGQKNHRVVPISMLDLMAWQYKADANPDGKFTCIINALSGRLFVATYDKNCKKLSDEKMILETELPQMEGDKVFLKEEFAGVLGGISITPETLLNLALKNEEKQTVSAFDVCPVYIRKSQAEENA